MDASDSLIACPKCGASAALGEIGGLCPSCLARGAAVEGGGWLQDFAPAPRDSLPEIPGWKVLSQLGMGGMGRVYLAESETDAQSRALKVLDGRWSANPVIVARFEREAEALRHLEHPNIVRVFDSTETEDGRLCLVLEYVEGCDLSRLLRGEKLTPERAIEIFQKVCAAAAHAHELGFLHRDIKPSNIIVGRDGLVKLLDFGLAKEISDDDVISAVGGLTATTDQFGTAYYLAPERMLTRRANEATDVYSLGVLLYHLLSGRMPLGNYTPLSQLSSLPREIDLVVKRALEADPMKRTSSVSELGGQVAKIWRAHLAGQGRNRQWRRLAAVSGILALVAAATGLGAWWQHEKMKPPPPTVFPEPATATREQPWVNGLGMKFVPVPGTRVLFSTYELRYRDAEEFMKTRTDWYEVAWMPDLRKRAQRMLNNVAILDASGRMAFNGNPSNPGFPVTPDHPKLGMGIRDAQTYCYWLTWKEQNEGRLKLGQFYRLPTLSEWFAACGGENAPLRPGNVAGPEATEPGWPRNWPKPKGPRDPFPRASPVGSFPVELYGLYDISGNASEWVLDGEESPIDRPAETQALLLGPNYTDYSSEQLSFAYRHPPRPRIRLAYVGTRLVLDYQGTREDIQPSSAVDSPENASSIPQKGL